MRRSATDHIREHTRSRCSKSLTDWSPHRNANLWLMKAPRSSPRSGSGCPGLPSIGYTYSQGLGISQQKITLEPRPLVLQNWYVKTLQTEKVRRLGLKDSALSMSTSLRYWFCDATLPTNRPLETVLSTPEIRNSLVYFLFTRTNKRSMVYNSLL